jgi:hypothetical protein
MSLLALLPVIVHKKDKIVYVDSVVFVKITGSS